MERKEVECVLVDTLIRFETNGTKVVVHCYNTTQKIMINGSGYMRFFEKYLDPYFKRVIGENLLEIQKYNKVVTDTLGKIKRKDVKFRPGAKFACNKCDFSSENTANLSTHRKALHLNNSRIKSGVTFSSTRDNSIVIDVMNEDLSVIDILDDTTEDDVRVSLNEECRLGENDMSEQMLPDEVLIKEKDNNIVNIDTEEIVDTDQKGNNFVLVNKVAEETFETEKKEKVVGTENTEAEEIDVTEKQDIEDNNENNDKKEIVVTVNEESNDGIQNNDTEEMAETEIKVNDNVNVLLENFTLICDECGNQFEGRTEFESHHLDFPRCKKSFEQFKCKKY